MASWRPTREDDFSAVVIRPNGTILIHTFKLEPYEWLGEFVAIGMPALFMMGALHAGATAEDAVRLAVEHTDGGGGSVQVELLARVTEVAA